MVRHYHKSSEFNVGVIVLKKFDAIEYIPSGGSEFGSDNAVGSAYDVGEFWHTAVVIFGEGYEIVARREIVMPGSASKVIMLYFAKQLSNVRILIVWHKRDD